MTQLFRVIASLRLTVVLFACAIFIIFAGTVAQVDQSIFQVLERYFRTAFAWIEFRIFFPRSWENIRGSFYFPVGWLIEAAMLVKFYFPGGWLIATAMLVNLIAAHSVRFKLVATGSRRMGGLFVLLLGAALTAWVIVRGSHVDMTTQTLSSYWRILYQLAAGGAAGLVLLAGAAMLFRQRAGIVLLHSGIALMIISELVTGTFAVEASMTLREGETASFIDVTGEYELSFTDESDSAFDQVVVIPASKLEEGGTIRDPQLSVDVEVLQWINNTTFPINTTRAPQIQADLRVDRGLGMTHAVISRPSGAGVEGMAVDAPAAVVRFIDKQTHKPIGTYLLSTWWDANFSRRIFDERQTLHIGENEFAIALRPRREYLRSSETADPYTITLEDFSHDLYPGTNMPRNFSSDILLNDTSAGVTDRPVRIWMNNPMRYGGLTFYQASYLVDNSGTVLQVVRNPGWMTPYLACMIVATGMIWHFGFSLARFTKRRNKIKVHPSIPAAPKGQSLWIPLVVIVIAGGWLGSKAYDSTAKPGEMDLKAFGQLPVMYEGRLKPIDTVARNSLRILSGRQTFIDADDKRQSAVRWLLDAITDRDPYHRVFRIESLDLQEALGLPRRKGFRYALNDFNPDTFENFVHQIQNRVSRDASQRDRFDRQAIHFLNNQWALHRRLVDSNRLPLVQNQADVQRAARVYEQLKQNPLPMAVMPGEGKNEWRSVVGAAFDPAIDPQDLHVVIKIFSAYGKQDVAAFNSMVAELHAKTVARRGAIDALEKVRFETWYNHFSPFYYCAVLYVFAFILTAIGWLVRPAMFNRAATTLLIVTFVVHTAALIARIYISGRPPVTNLYSSAVFIGWGCVGISMLLEKLYRNGVGNTVAAIAGFVTLLIAHFLAGDGDTFVVLQAVLDTQFWLATHVVCITLGYSATFLAGLFAIIFIVRGVFTKSLNKQAEQELSRMIYGSICFALLFSFVGTVLGGLWADDSWGRFWGWDPKENGALMIVLCNALILHARWGGMVKYRGIAVLAVVGNIVTAWSWFGVNQLSVGLHAYGFTDSATMWLLIFVNSQIVLIALGLMPRRFWVSGGEGLRLEG